MRRFIALVAFFGLFASCIWASSATFVYGNSISSIDMDRDVRQGQVFTDPQSNVLVVKSVHENVPYGAESPGCVVEFDKFITRGKYEAGSVLTRRGPIHSIGIIGGLYHLMAEYSISCALYPFYPVVMGGISYDIPSVFKGGSFKVSSFLALGGIGVALPLARLWDSENTFIVNGRISSWCAAGVSVSDSVTFACSYGFSYRHSVGQFHWDLGGMWLYRNGTAGSISPYIGAGAYI